MAQPVAPPRATSETESKMGLRRRYLVLAGVLGAAVAVVPSVASSETPAVEAVNTGLYNHAWSPAQATLAAGEALTIRNSTATPHGVEWHSGPATPVCNGIPVGTTPSASGTNWSGTCTFSKPGTYIFYCTVHGPEMTETITVGGGETTPTTTATTPTAPTPTTPTTTAPPGAEPGPLAGAASLRSSQRGGTVRGALPILPAGAGARLEIDVFAKGAALGLGGHARRVRVARLVRASASAGRLAFAIALNARARRALAHRRRLSLSVQITLTPPHGRALTVKRTVVEHV